MKIHNLKTPKPLCGPVLEYATVIDEVNDNCFLVIAPFGEVRAEQAFSCLVKPVSGDTVLLSVDQDGYQCHILSVLQRKQAAESVTDLMFTGQVNMRVRQGGLAVVADRDMTLNTSAALRCAADQFTLQAKEGEVHISYLSFAGDFLLGQMRRLKTVAVNVDQIFSQFTQRLGNAFRYVKEHEEVQSGSSRHLVEETLTMHAKNVVHTAEKIAKINADQIHLG